MDSEYWSHYFLLLGKRLLHGSAYPACGIAIAQAWLDPDASLVGCLATAAGVFLFVAGLAGLCVGIAWLLTNWE